jgi:hypothetical protein
MLPPALALTLMLLQGPPCTTTSSSLLQLLQLSLSLPQPLLALALLPRQSAQPASLLLQRQLEQASLLWLCTASDTSQLTLLRQVAMDVPDPAAAAEPAPAPAAAAAAAALLQAAAKLLRCWFKSKLRLPMLVVRTRLGIAATPAVPAATGPAGPAAANADVLSEPHCVPGGCGCCCGSTAAAAPLLLLLLLLLAVTLRVVLPCATATLLLLLLVLRAATSYAAAACVPVGCKLFARLVAQLLLGLLPLLLLLPPVQGAPVTLNRYQPSSGIYVNRG